MTSAEFNVTSVTSLTLDGFVQLSGHSSLFFFLFLLVYLFVLFSDSLVVYLICSQPSLRQPMFAFVAAVLLNSLAGSTAFYPKLLSDLLSGSSFVQVSRSTCLFQAFMLNSLGGSGFLLLSAMAFDRYLSICQPLRYAALLSPSRVVVLLLLCWLIPAALVSGATLLATRLPLCHMRFHRISCDIYSFVSLSCGKAMLTDMYGLLSSVIVLFLPIAFVLFTYGRILSICLQRSPSFSNKALHTCLPHLIVFTNYSIGITVELLQRRLQPGSLSVTSSVLVVVVQSTLNPVIYGLKMKLVLVQVKRVLSCRRD